MDTYIPGTSRKERTARRRRQQATAIVGTIPSSRNLYWRRPTALGGGRELRGCDTNLAIALASVLDTVTTNGASFVLNLIQQGTGSWNRIGRKITMKSVRIKIAAICRHFQNNQDITASLLRAVVVYDKQPSSGAIPTFDTIFGSTDQQGTETGAILDNLRYDNTGRFRVLSDKIITSTPSAPIGIVNGDFQDAQYYCDEYINLKGRESIFSATNNPSTIADISTGALYIFFRANANTGATSYWQIQSTSTARLRFYD